MQRSGHGCVARAGGVCLAGSGWWCTTACGCGGNTVSDPCDAPGWCSDGSVTVLAWLGGRRRRWTAGGAGLQAQIWALWARFRSGGPWTGLVPCAWVCNHLLLLLPPPPSFPTWSVIRLKRIYNFWCSMLVYKSFALCFITLRGVFMHFSELTY
jgi:hypothetical protein